MKIKLWIFLLLISVLSVRVLAAGYTFTPINYPGSSFTQPQGINDSGQVVGYYLNAPSIFPHGFLFKNGTYTAINGRPGSTVAIPYGINNSGQIVGNDNPGGESSAFLLSGSAYTDVAYPGYMYNVAVGISNNGQILGTCQLSGVTIMYVLSGGVYTKLPDPGQAAGPTGINNSGQIVGNFGSTSGFLFSGGIYTTLTGPAGALSASASGINDNGQIVGFYLSNTSGFLEDHGFILAGGVYTTLDVQLPAENLFFGINNSAWVVGGFGYNVGGGFIGAPTAPLSISSLAPNSAAAGGLAFEMTVNGSGFPADAVVHWNGNAISTTYGSASQLTAFVTAGLLSTAGTASVTVVSSETAESNALTFTINPAGSPSLSIFTAPILPLGHAGTAYATSLIVGGGAAPYSWSLIAGALPSGLSFSSAGTISGTPTVAEDLSFTVQAMDSASRSALQTYFLTIDPSTATGASFIGSMPHLAAQENWTTAFTLVNKQAASATAQLSFFGDPSDTSGNGPLALPLTFPQASAAAPAPAASYSQSILANASLIVETAGPQTSPVQIGSAQLAASGDVDGFAIFQQIPTAQEAVVPMETRNAPSYLLAFDNTNQAVLGVAVENVSTQDASIGVVLRDGSGSVIGNGTVALGGSGHASFVLSTQFPVTAGIQGTAEFDTPSGGRISVLGIRFTRPNNALTTIPALANVGPGGGSIAHIATGNGWETTFVLINAGATAAPIHLKFFADVTGTALPLSLSFPQSGGGATTVASSVDQTLAAGATLLVQSTGELSDPAPTVGSAQLITAGNVSGFVIFRYSLNGQEAVVPLESRNASGFIVAFDNTAGTATGIAINSVSPQAIRVPVVVRDDSGAQIASDTLSLAANGHLSFTLGTGKYPATANIRGTLEFDTPSGGQIGVLGIRIPTAHTFTTLPALVK